jgi:tetratricopeptide (TPR) repeat protein
LSFGIYLLICALILALALGLLVYRLVKVGPSAEGAEDRGSFSLLWIPFAGLSGVLAYASTVTVEEPNGDSWIYLAYVREYIGADQLGLSNPLFGASAGDSYLSFRTMINGWLLEQAALSRVSGITPVDLVLDYLAPVLTILSLLAIYALAHVLFNREVALLAGSFTALLFLVDLQAIVQTALMSPANEVATRVTEDKYVTRFLFLPIALGLAFLYLKERKIRYLLVFAFVCWSVAIVHPIGLIFVGVCTAGFGVFHLIANPRSREAWKNVLSLGVAILSIGLPPVLYLLFTGSPLLFRLGEGSTNSQAEALISTWEASKRLMVLGEDSYIMHPALLLNPLVLLAYVLGVPFLAFHLKKSLAARLLLGVLVFTAIVIYVPLISTPLAKIVGPWVLIRFSWPISLAAPIVLTWMIWELLTYLRTRFAESRSRALEYAGPLLPLLVVVILVAVASPMAWASVRSVNEIDELPQDASACEDPTFHWMQREITEPATILAPYEENSCIPAHSAANVLSLRGISPSNFEEEIRMFFVSSTIGEQDIQNLLDQEVDYALVPAGSMLNAQLRHLPGFTPLDNPGQRYRMYAIDRNALMTTTTVSANTLMKNEDLAGAEALYLAALNQGIDEQFLAYAGLGMSYARQELYLDAAASYEQALSIYPDEPSLYPPLADAYNSGGDVVSARTVLENGIARFPQNAELRTTLASLLMYQDPAAAAEVQRTVVDMYPEVPDYRTRLGTLLSLSGDDEAADRQFERVIDQNPLSAELHTRVGFANEIADREEASIRHYRRALEINPGFQLAQENLERLQEGG